MLTFERSPVPYQLLREGEFKNGRFKTWQKVREPCLPSDLTTCGYHKILRKRSAASSFGTQKESGLGKWDALYGAGRRPLRLVARATRTTAARATNERPTRRVADRAKWRRTTRSRGRPKRHATRMLTQNCPSCCRARVRLVFGYYYGVGAVD